MKSIHVVTAAPQMISFVPGTMARVQPRGNHNVNISYCQ